MQNRSAGYILLGHMPHLLVSLLLSMYECMMEREGIKLYVSYTYFPTYMIISKLESLNAALRTRAEITTQVR